MEDNPSDAVAKNSGPRPCLVLTRNRAEYLERALRSIFAAIELYPNTEVIVIDGASVDGTVELLHSFSAQIAFWISERDSASARR